MFVIDTNVASGLMRPEPAPTVAAWVAERNAEEIYLTAVSQAELLYGVAILPAGRSERLTARSQLYPDLAALFLSPAICGISRARE